MSWINENRHGLTLLLMLFVAINNFLYFKHVLAKKCRSDDFGYFLRLWRAGDRDGKIVTYLSILSVILGTVLIISLFK